MSSVKRYEGKQRRVYVCVRLPWVMLDEAKFHAKGMRVNMCEYIRQAIVVKNKEENDKP